MISIIIPTFNSAKTLRACLHSVIEQTYREKEILIIDGGSTDDTISIINEFSEKEPSLRFISEPDNGIYDAMNKGISLSQGEWLYFLGSDDSLADNQVLEDVQRVLKTGKVKFLYGDVRLVPSKIIYGGKYNWFRLLKRNISHQAIFYHRDLFDALGSFQQRYSIVADWVFNIHCFRQGVKKKYIRRVIADFCEDGLSSTNRKDVNFQKDFSQIMKQNFPFYVQLWDYLKYRFK